MLVLVEQQKGRNDCASALRHSCLCAVWAARFTEFVSSRQYRPSHTTYHTVPTSTLSIDQSATERVSHSVFWLWPFYRRWMQSADHRGYLRHVLVSRCLKCLLPFSVLIFTMHQTYMETFSDVR